MSEHYAETKYGFEWGAAKIQRAFSDAKKGWVTLTLDTPRHAGHGNIQVYITRTGKVRIHDARGEWSPPNAPDQARLQPSPEAGCSPSFRAELERIANDYIPDNDGQAPLALGEMREAIQYLLANSVICRKTEDRPCPPL